MYLKSQLADSMEHAPGGSWWMPTDFCMKIRTWSEVSHGLETQWEGKKLNCRN